MAKFKKSIVEHKGVLFLVLILIFFVLINFIPFFFKEEPVEVRFTGEDEVMISSKLPITDFSGKSLDVLEIQDGIIGHSEFSVELEEKSNVSVQYEIYLEDITESDVFKYDYVKIYLTDGDDIPYEQFGGNSTPSYKDMKVSLDYPGKRVLFSGVIKGNEVQKFKLRIWIADVYVLDDKLKEFKGKISVKTIS